MNKDKAEKNWTVLNSWLPAVNGIRAQHGCEPWAFLEPDGGRELAEARNAILSALH